MNIMMHPNHQYGSARPDTFFKIKAI